jgi:formylglycine-generating enzyme
VPGGKFLLGSPDTEPERNEDEGPQIEVTVDPMWVGKHEVNWAQYEVFMGLHDAFQSFQADRKRVVDESNRVDAVTAPTPLYEPSFTLEYGDEPDQPAVTMTQYAAQQYTKWLSRISGPQYRLPTEAEWEYAVRAGSTAAYSWGDSAEEEISKYATYADNNDGSLPIVGSRLPNAFGLHDMLGGVGEWTVNQYDEAGYGVFAAKAPLKAIDVVVWPTEEFPCVVRGGTWEDEPAKLRCAARVASHPDWKEKDPRHDASCTFPRVAA